MDCKIGDAAILDMLDGIVGLMPYQREYIRTVLTAEKDGRIVMYCGGRRSGRTYTRKLIEDYRRIQREANKESTRLSD
ncbi:MAG: hypothetical protein KKB38_20465 [Gammaproteobacteria bacterium]|nr:hypothetical protein [Gammaproteobacteria bacterium]